MSNKSPNEERRGKIMNHSSQKRNMSTIQEREIRKRMKEKKKKKKKKKKKDSLLQSTCT